MLKYQIIRALGHLIPTSGAKLAFYGKYLLPKIDPFPTGDVPLVKYAPRISIAFASDSRGIGLTAVAITSLLEVSAGKCDYDIYCVLAPDSSDKDRDLIRQQVSRYPGQSVRFLEPNGDFDNASGGKWPTPTWYRLMLPQLLPALDRIIYADIDVVFCRDLVEADRIDLGGSFIAAVNNRGRGRADINAGVLIMDLAAIRKEGIYEKFASHSERGYSHLDQDVLNKTCDGRMLYLPIRYNFSATAGKRYCKHKSAREIYELKYNLVI